MTRPTTRWRLLALPLVTVAALSVAACSSGSDNATSEPASYNGAATSDDGAGDVGASPALSPLDADDMAFAETSALGSKEETPAQERAVIQTGAVSLRSGDVAKTRFEVQKLLDLHEGLIDNERTETDKEGDVRLSRLVVRVPSSDFDAVMTKLATLGTLVESSRKAKDVTTQVIDTDVRIRAQEQSLARVEALLARAESIRDIMAIEAQLTRRQADLDALKQTRAFLADQTEMSTINVYLEKETPETAPAPPKKHHNAFVTGLIAGWDAFTDVAGGLAKGTGASLPFLGVLLLLAWPLWLGIRRLASASRNSIASEAAEPVTAD